MELKIGLNAIASYRRLNYEIWYALAEFVDNSTQSYFNNRAALDKAFEENEKLGVHITYDAAELGAILRVTDNAMGMSREELERALQVGVPPINNTNRCRFGMGMKTSACWIGNRWSITTKKLGETEEFTVHLDVQRIIDGDPNLEMTTRERSADEHYTVIEIRDHNRQFKGPRTIGKIKRFLSSMYRQDFRDNILHLQYNNDDLTKNWNEFDDRILRNRANEVMKKHFNFEVGGKSVSGWAAVFESGARVDAGFSIFHSGRIVYGWPDAWRPELIYGENSNDLVNQRLFGEVTLDDFDVTHTKDNIQWYSDEEDQVANELKDRISDLIGEAKITKKARAEKTNQDAEVSLAMSNIRDELLSPEMADKLKFDQIPAAEAIRKSWSSIIQPIIESADPDLTVKVGSLTVWAYATNANLGPNDPYVIAEASAKNDKVITLINLAHPHLDDIHGQDNLTNYFKHCIYDSVAEWVVRSQQSRIDPDSVKLVKDGLLRVRFDIQEHSHSP